MKKLLPVLIAVFFSVNIYAQVFDGEWTCDYATYDEETNGTGFNTVSVTVLKENTFVALVSIGGTRQAYYLVGYDDADSAKGRLGTYGYGSQMNNFHQMWGDLEPIYLYDPNDLAMDRSDSLIYVPSNDDPGNILVFKLTTDTVLSSEYRLPVNNDESDFYMWGIDLDGDSRVYITGVDSLNQSYVKIYGQIGVEPAWTEYYAETPTVLQEIIIPDAGEARDVAVHSSGKVLYVSNWHSKKIYCYIGSPEEGYTLYNGFNFSLVDTLIGRSTPYTGDIVDTIMVGPWGLRLMPEKNVLFVACDANFRMNRGYQYGRVYALNPNTGEVLDTLDVARWYYDQTGSVSSRPGGTTPGNVATFTSVYNCDFDENEHLYTSAYYGWAVEKWTFSGTIPTIPLTIVSVESDGQVVPEQFSLYQNYPNPFNPKTTIKFTLNEDANVELTVYNCMGQRVKTLIPNVYTQKGEHKAEFDASSLASGVYFYRLQSGTNALVKKMTLLK